MASYTVPVTPTAVNVASASVETDETTSSAAFVDLATSGPAVTLTTGTTAIVTFSAATRGDSGTFNGQISVAVSGASTVAASTTNGMMTLSTGSGWSNCNRTIYFTGLTAGSNTFTMKYGSFSAGNSVHFVSRNITVLAP